MTDVQDYMEQLLENVADEVNVKEVIAKRGDDKSVYSFDTVHRKSIGLDDNWALYSFLFSGDLHDDMNIIRKLCTTGLDQRSKEKIKVRQPLNSLTIDVSKYAVQG
jgi:hypothetical protein